MFHVGGMSSGCGFRRWRPSLLVTLGGQGPVRKHQPIVGRRAPRLGRLGHRQELGEVKLNQGCIRDDVLSPVRECVRRERSMVADDRLTALRSLPPFVHRPWRRGSVRVGACRA